jgi:methyl-accepting chemotaxis protein
MSTLRSMNLSARLKFATALTCAGLLGVATFTYLRLETVSSISEGTAKHRIPQLAEIANVELNVTRASLQLRHAMLARNDAERDAALGDIQTRRELITKDLSTYESQLFTNEGRERFQSIPPVISAFWTQAEVDVKLIQAGQKQEAFAHLVDHTIPARNALLKELSGTVDYQLTSAERDIGKVQAGVQQTLSTLMAAFLFVGVSLCALTAWVGHSLRERVQRSREVAERVRDGDLSIAVNDSTNDEFSPLLKAMADMQGSLVRLVTHVRDNANSVATASAEIAQGSQDLSLRTEQQASALQQTAATMQELGTTVRHNAEHAQEATSMAQDAANVAERGGQVVREVVATMQGINEASRKISDIISVIDGIAFQTNILALNAAVEAARAGEQGRGFAVVASEVRSLAQRSAEAAREIKQLITSSAEQVDRGSSLVSEAGNTMSQIVDAIQRVNTIVGEISHASTEQHAGVQVVGQAIEQMDQGTQQNAALVEQSTAASESLQQQAKELVHSVAAFRV